MTADPGKQDATVKTPPPPGRGAGVAANGNGKITREVVLAAALKLIDAGGADALTMRRLAAALDRDPMILYRHAPNKAALLDGVADTVLAQLTVDSGDPDWAGQLRTVARHYRALALAHPNAVPLLVTRPLATPLAKYWMRVCSEIKNRGTRDVLMVVCDGLKGLPDAVNAVWEKTIVQTCIVHMRRKGTGHRSRKTSSPPIPLRPNLRRWTGSLSSPASGRKRYPAVIRLWENAGRNSCRSCGSTGK